MPDSVLYDSSSRRRLRMGATRSSSRRSLSRIPDIFNRTVSALTPSILVQHHALEMTRPVAQVQSSYPDRSRAIKSSRGPIEPGAISTAPTASRGAPEGAPVESCDRSSGGAGVHATGTAYAVRGPTRSTGRYQSLTTWRTCTGQERPATASYPTGGENTGRTLSRLLTARVRPASPGHAWLAAGLRPATAQQQDTTAGSTA